MKNQTFTVVPEFGGVEGLSLDQEKEILIESLGLVFEHHVSVLNYTIQSVEDIKLFVQDFLGENIPVSINKFKMFKQTQNMVSKQSFIQNFNINAIEVLLQQKIRRDVGMSLVEKGAVRLYDIISLNPNHSAESLLRELERPEIKVSDSLSMNRLFEGLV
ncbi:hypothetical protein [Halobacillus sp. Marseille-P3879]|uniref:hypothetical protein n=1 Tax=Halobacillus sp. Marseille-P3879 TaxID=2045014 RepID=UPI000C7CBBDD|nr:hypothetical protein [Halobacillus sp. Marseille-P3879]